MHADIRLKELNTGRSFFDEDKAIVAESTSIKYKYLIFNRMITSYYVAPNRNATKRK